MNYLCTDCGSTYPFHLDTMVCRECWTDTQTGPPTGILEVVYSKEELTKIGSPYLPVDPRGLPQIGVGNTPLISAPRLSKLFELPNLYIKNDSQNPTGSLKDRASWAVAAQAKMLNAPMITVASTGNAGSSMAGIGAAVGIEVTLFIPKSAPRAKLVQARMYGADLVEVDGTYDVAYDMALNYARETGSLSRNTAYNPITIEGKKTASVEIAEQLQKAPDVVFVPCGDGVILAGVYRGFEDLVAAGKIDEVPHIVCVQAEGSQAITAGFKTGVFSAPEKATTLADSIQVDVPRNGRMAVHKLQKHSGSCLLVSDDEILDAQSLLAEQSGVFAEPAAAAAVAGLKIYRSSMSGDETVVVLITGNGLKDIDAAQLALDRRTSQ